MLLNLDDPIQAGKFAEVQESSGRPVILEYVGKRTSNMYTDHMSLKYTFHINFTKTRRMSENMLVSKYLVHIS